MRADGRTVPDAEIIQTDVCIIGAGPAGIVLARQLSRAGRDVVLLEQGDASGAGLLEPLGTTDSIGVPYSIESHRGGGIGGSVHKWLVDTPLGDGFGRIPEFSAEDFEERAWIPNSGWPFSKQELVPHYRAARMLFDVDWPSSDPEREWERSLSEAHPTVRLEGISARVFPFASPAVFPGPMSRALDQSDRAIVLTNAAAVELVGDHEATKLDHVDVATEEGTRFRVVASLFVLAAGGIENARLLLNSRGRWPDGLGNQYDLVGRYFMEHPRFTAGFLVPGDPGIFADRRLHAISVVDGIPTQAKYLLTPDVAESEGVANHLFFFGEAQWTVAAIAAAEGWYDPEALQVSRAFKRAIQRREFPEDAPGLLREVGRNFPRIWRSARVSRRLEARSRQMSGADHRGPDLFKIEMMAEQLPNPQSRVTLLPDPDRFGAQRAALDWQFTRAELEGFAIAQERFCSALEGAGLGKAYSFLRPGELPRGLHAASHHMGTTRMHRDPRRGVVDDQGRVHGMQNLYVAGSSIFPTGGSANPTLTVLALTLRLADALRGRS